MLCTGNTCRSPMAAALLAARLAEAGIDAHVHSAGLLFDGQPATDHGVAVMAARGIDTSGHRSKKLRGDLLAGPDLVVGMAREHVREAVAARPDVWNRTFTLKELVRRGEAVGGRAGGEELSDWLARLHAGRRLPDLLGESASSLQRRRAVDDDVADPVGGPLREYQRTAEELDDLTVRLAGLLAPRHR